MSGPALKQYDAHHAIHDAAFTEAEEMTAVVRALVEQGDEPNALQAAFALVEHWETRTLRHAESEETGFYLEAVQANPELHDDVLVLARDHAILRRIVQTIKQRLRAKSSPKDVLPYFQALLIVNEIHSRDEEQRLLLGGE